jgi:hypothetical protein
MTEHCFLHGSPVAGEFEQNASYLMAVHPSVMTKCNHALARPNVDPGTRTVEFSAIYVGKRSRESKSTRRHGVLGRSIDLAGNVLFTGLSK